MTPLDSDSEFEALLDYLRRNRGFDFSGYKRASLMRRVRRRMQMMRLEGFSDYADYLEVHPQEFTLLFNTILINVTSFFRDQATWDHLCDEIIPRLAAGKEATEPIRVWSAGTASGEEAYTAAMVLAEVLGEEAFGERVKIYATDVDEEALTLARLASYSAREVSGVPQNLLEKYFETVNDRHVFRKDLRRQVIFGRHDLVQDAPISRIDLLICRNTLMYFNAEVQARILARFHFALNDHGFLFLGRAETLFTHNHLFSSVDLKRRIFAKVSKMNLRDRLSIMAQGGTEEVTNHLTKHVRFREAAFDASPVAHLALDLQGFVALANERARALLSLTPRDMSRPFQDLEFSYRLTGLRNGIEQAYTERRTISLSELDWPTTSGDLRFLDVQIVPLLESGGALLGASITFADVTIQKRLRDELEHTNQELETAYEELQSTNEELETTNEELQSTIEELETTNEELQSTNEELETMNEELQSTNEELQTINDELHRRTTELNQLNAFLESVLTSLRGGVAVLSPDLAVQVWSEKAEDLWGLRPEEAQGKNFLSLDIGLPVEQLRQPIRSCLSGESEYLDVVLEATNRRGRRIQCKVSCIPMDNSTEGKRSAILLMEEVDHPGAARESA